MNEKIESFDVCILDMMKSNYYGEIFLQNSKELNPLNLIRDFLIDLKLENEFKEYCKMRFSLLEKKK